MRKSIATVSLSGTLRQKLEAVAAARFDAIELFESDFINFNGSAKELHSIAADLGLGLDLYQPFRDFEGMPDELFSRSLERAERKFDLMQELGVPLMLVCSNTSPVSLGDTERSAAQLHELAERAARRNLRTAVDAMRSLLYLESRVRSRLEQARDDAAPGAAARTLQRIELFDPPDAARLDGCAFLEFAVDEAAAVQLGALFEQLGFARAGRHRSKAVSLYRQGDIQFIVNAQPGSDARTRFDEQGPSVCAIGLSTPDPLRAANRAA